MSTPSAYPLAWPPGWPRTVSRQPWPRSPNLPAALAEAQKELRLLGARNVVLNSNVTLGAERPQDPGVVAYATYDGMQIAIPCDRWTTVAGNLRAIAKTIEAMRGMERWGAKHMIRAMIQGFTALPAPEDWRAVFGFRANETVTLQYVEDTYRSLARKHHPDIPGGSTREMERLNAAIAAARAHFASAGT